jgi:hypothetical protein
MSRKKCGTWRNIHGRAGPSENNDELQIADFKMQMDEPVTIENSRQFAIGKLKWAMFGGLCEKIHKSR